MKPVGVQRWATVAIGTAVVGLLAWLTFGQRPKSTPPQDAAVSADASTAVAIEDASLGVADLDASFVLTLNTDASLPSGAPRAVKIGVVLVQFEGAEGASSSARSKRDALTLATKLAGDARSDFRRAVAAGDPGSAEDIGRIPRNVLDPTTEIAVFSLKVGDVSEPIETPKGYWIVKRSD